MIKKSSCINASSKVECVDTLRKWGWKVPPSEEEITREE